VTGRARHGELSVWYQGQIVLSVATRSRSGSVVPHPEQFRTVLPAAAARRVRAAHLPTSKSLESFAFAFQPTLSERLIQELGTLGFVPTATNIVLLGPPGVGKTHLALALTARTLEAGYSTRFTTLRQLADELETTSWRQQRRRYLSPRLLVIDEVGYLRLTASQAQQLFNLVTARYEQAPIVLTSNRSFAE
jgi:DNA replication protein DnaC